MVADSRIRHPLGSGDADQSFIRKAGREGRIALTRKRNLGGDSGRLIVVTSDRVEGQICEVMGVLSISRIRRTG